MKVSGGPWLPYYYSIMEEGQDNSHIKRMKNWRLSTERRGPHVTSYLDELRTPLWKRYCYFSGFNWDSFRIVTVIWARMNSLRLSQRCHYFAANPSCGFYVCAWIRRLSVRRGSSRMKIKIQTSIFLCKFETKQKINSYIHKLISSSPSRHMPQELHSPELRDDSKLLCL